MALAVISVAGGGASAATGAGGCRATARIDTQWGSGSTGGEVVTITVANTAATTATTWSVTWVSPGDQRIVNAWNATVSTSGDTVTAVNAAWNGRLAPGADTNFGMLLAGVGPAPVLSCADDATPATSSPPVSSSASSSTPPGPGDVNVTEADNRTTVNMAVGRTLGVSLPANYRPFTSPSAALILVSSSGGYPTGQPLSELFRAVGADSFDLATETDMPCNHDPTPCPGPYQPWRLHVILLYPPPSQAASR